MASLAETIDTALAAVGRETEDQLRDLSTDFEGLKLADEERVSALATAIAAIAIRYHKRHVQAYLDAVRTWSLEIAEMLQPVPTELRYIPDTPVIEAAARTLYAGLDGVVDRMREGGIDVRDRLITELALVTRFLGQHDPNTITIAVMAVNRALGDPQYHRGAVVQVPLREVAASAPIEPGLASMKPRGTA
ncbi:MAG TPA: hypothetical protein VKU84_08070 [Stellaceae bacterium]|nr:hypothetical protein [Stellaceae bacterium]